MVTTIKSILIGLITFILILSELILGFGTLAVINIPRAIIPIKAFKIHLSKVSNFIGDLTLYGLKIIMLIMHGDNIKLIEKNRATDFEFLNGKIFIDAASPNSLVSSFKKLTTDFNEKDPEEESFERVFNIDELSDKAQFEWALAVPIMIINLMILGVCLTSSAPRQGRMISLLPGLLIFFLYLSSLIIFRDGISEDKSFAYFGMWPVHFLVLLTSIFLFVRGDVVSKILFTKTNIAKAIMASILLIILLWLI